MACAEIESSCALDASASDVSADCARAVSRTSSSFFVWKSESGMSCTCAERRANENAVESEGEGEGEGEGENEDGDEAEGEPGVTMRADWGV